MLLYLVSLPKILSLFLKNKINHVFVLQTQIKYTDIIDYTERDKYTVHPYYFQISHCEFTYVLKFICSPHSIPSAFMVICGHVLSGGKFESTSTYLWVF